MSWLTTFSGEKFFPLQPDVKKIHIEDIAHALSNQCRFAGHTSEFYSVAQHSVIVSEILASQGKSHLVQLKGLLHDATEAYLMDIPRPLKVLPFMAEYRDVERRLELHISTRFFGFASPICNEEIKKADLIALATEARDLVSDPDAMHSWEIIQGLQPVQAKIIPLQPRRALEAFMFQWNYLNKALDNEARKGIEQWQEGRP